MGKAPIYSVLPWRRTVTITELTCDTNEHIRNVLYTSFESLEYINGQHKENVVGWTVVTQSEASLKTISVLSGCQIM